MLLFDMKTYLRCLPFGVHKELINELSDNSAWKVVANYLVENYSNNFSMSWLKSLELESKITNERRSAELLVDELTTGSCTVGGLCKILRNCDVLWALYLLRGYEPLEIVTQPRSTVDGRPEEIAIGEKFTLSCKATGLPPPRYQWFHENVELLEQKTSNLSFLVTSPAQVGEYRCRIEQYNRDEERLGEKFSDFAILQIKSMPVVIYKQPIPVDLIVGDLLEIRCEAKSYPEPRYQWFKDTSELQGETSTVLRRKNAKLKHEGIYYCHVTNGGTNDSISNKIKVTVDPPLEKALAKIALLIGNSDYMNHQKLSKPDNDVAAIAKKLENIDFHVVCLNNLTHEEMIRAIEIFSRALIPGVYGFFYFAGHGIFMHDYRMTPIDLPKSPGLTDTISQSDLLKITLEKNPAFLVVVLDMCLEVPDIKENKQIHEERPELVSYNNNENYIVAHSTCNFKESLEGEKAKNGVYATHLIKNIASPKPALAVFHEVARCVARSKKGEHNQVPQIFAVTKRSCRLTDKIDHSKPLDPIVQQLKEATTFETVKFQENVEKPWLNSFEITLLNPPFLNAIRISIPGKEYKVNFLRYDDLSEFESKNDKIGWLRDHQSDIISNENECYIYNLQRHNRKAGLLMIFVNSKDNCRSPFLENLSYMENLPTILQEL